MAPADASERTVADQVGSTGAKVTVSPEEFTFVHFDAAEIRAIVADLAARLDIANPIHVVVDEATPLAKVYEEIEGSSSDATITLHAESGALEDRRHPMSFSADDATESLGRILLRAHDRLRPGFGDAPGDLDLTLAQNAAWDAHCAGRLARMEVDVNEQRWRYNHRNRFGFSDAADAAFDRLWSTDDLTWAEITAPI